MILSMMLFTKPRPPAKRGLVDSQFIGFLLKMTYCCWASPEHYCFYRCQTCRLFLRVYLRGNSDANRRDFCHHRLCFLPCVSPPFLKKYGYKEILPQETTGLRYVKRGIARSPFVFHTAFSIRPTLFRFPIPAFLWRIFLPSLFFSGMCRLMTIPTQCCQIR